MKYLLDTHTFIWWDAEPNRLPAKVLALCQNPSNQLFLSVASIWEMQIKHQLGKLVFNTSLDLLISQQIENNNILLLPVKPTHIFSLSDLPTIHKDPFDRLLISQARYEQTTLLSGDSMFADYPVEVVW